MILKSWPLPPEFAYISQYFGENPADYALHKLDGHEGWDFPCPVGTPTFATHDGWLDPRWRGEYGDSVQVHNGEGSFTLHAHLSKTIGVYGKTVVAGQIIGETGNTGSSTGPHLHWGIKLNGKSNPGYKNWLDPKDYLIKEDLIMPSKLSWQAQNCTFLRDPNDFVVRHVKDSGVWAAMLIDPDVLGNSNPFPGVQCMGRLWFKGDPDHALIRKGAQGAREYVALCAPRWATCPWIAIWHGPNEPYTGNPEDPNDFDPMRWLAEFYVELVRLAHQRDMKMGVGVFGTAQPAGPKANPLPTINKKWQIFGPACAEADALVVHEYGMDTLNSTPENEWHIGHYKRGVATLRDAGFRVPPIWITEHGIDRGGGATTDGWRVKLGGNEVEYMRQLAFRDVEYAADPLIQIVTPFVCHDFNWPSFTILESLSTRTVWHIKSKGAYKPDGGSMEFTAFEVTRCRTELNVVPATIKASVERNYVWLKELYKAGDTFAFALVYDSQTKRYKALKLETSRWQVVSSIDL